jgi:hypothetical protein
MKITDVSSLININIVNLTNFINIIDVNLLVKIFNLYLTGCSYLYECLQYKYEDLFDFEHKFHKKKMME